MSSDEEGPSFAERLAARRVKVAPPAAVKDAAPAKWSRGGAHEDVHDDEEDDGGAAAAASFKRKRSTESDGAPAPSAKRGRVEAGAGAGDSDDEDGEHESKLKGRRSKHAPVEMPSNRGVSRFRKVIEFTKREVRGRLHVSDLPHAVVQRACVNCTVVCCRPWLRCIRPWVCVQTLVSRRRPGK